MQLDPCRGVSPEDLFNQVGVAAAECREHVAVIENDSADRATANVAELVLSAAEKVRERV